MFKSKMANRLFIAKTIGFIIWLLWFLCIPYFFWEVDMKLKLWILFWYTTLWGIIWIMWVMDKHPVFTTCKMPFWFRWVFFWAWLNFVLALFIYNDLLAMMSSMWYDWFSPFRFALEWAIVGLIIDFFATQFGWEWRELCSK